MPWSRGVQPLIGLEEHIYEDHFLLYSVELAFHSVLVTHTLPAGNTESEYLACEPNIHRISDFQYLFRLQRSI